MQIDLIHLTQIHQDLTIIAIIMGVGIGIFLLFICLLIDKLNEIIKKL